MDVLAAHFEGREPMRPGFSGANDKLYVPSFFSFLSFAVLDYDTKED
jgi:hypothetical protein